mgnify:CR=1 FL=1
MVTDIPVISADSHITEHPETYSAYIDPKWRDKAPRMIRSEEKGDLFVLDGFSRPIAMGLVAAAGKDPAELSMTGAKFEDLHRSGWDSGARLAEHCLSSVQSDRWAAGLGKGPGEDAGAAGYVEGPSIRRE